MGVGGLIGDAACERAVVQKGEHGQADADREEGNRDGAVARPPGERQGGQSRGRVARAAGAPDEAKEGTAYSHEDDGGHEGDEPRQQEKRCPLRRPGEDHREEGEQGAGGGRIQR